MKKQIFLGLCLALLLCLLIQPQKAHALTALETEKECCLTLHYVQDGAGFADLPVRVYRVAEAFADGSFELIAPFSGYPVNIHGVTSQTEWQQIASTLNAYISAEQIAPTKTETTDANGTAVFSNLQTGLYLVCGVMAENQNGIFRFNDFMVYLPTPRSDGSFNYDIDAIPKCSKFTPHTQYSVVKLWKDAGNEEIRPQAVTVDILKDGVLQQTVILNGENNWSYSWTAPQDQGVWTVVEKDVPDAYGVSIVEKDGKFIITNTSTNPGKPPQTGDIFPVWMLTVVLCVSGLTLVLMGIWRERKHG